MVTFPPSGSTVRVRMINPGAVMTVKAESFVKPFQKGQDILNLTCAAFLIEHESSGKKVMFDLGVRKDYWNLPPVIQKRLGGIIPSLRVDTDVPEILKDHGVGLASICKSFGYRVSLTKSISLGRLVALSLGSYRGHVSFPSLNRNSRRIWLQGLSECTPWLSGQARFARAGF